MSPRLTYFILVGLIALASSSPAAEPAAAAQPQAAPSTSTVDPNTYIIGPGDVIEVFVWRNPDLTVTVPVRPDGKVSTRLVEDMEAVGKTPSQLARDIEKVLSEYIRSPQVNVIVTQPNSVFSQIKVVGEVGHPQGVAYRDGIRVLDVLIAVGGLGEFAAGNRARIIRTENGKQREIKVRLADLLKKGDLRQNIPLRPGDLLVIPQSVF